MEFLNAVRADVRVSEECRRAALRRAEGHGTRWAINDHFDRYIANAVAMYESVTGQKYRPEVPA